jgi:hypothetical protein
VVARLPSQEYVSREHNAIVMAFISFSSGSRTMNRFSLFLVICFASISISFSGCFGGGSGAEFPTTPVTIKVVYKGEPVSDASVAMVNSADYGKPVIAVGRTNAQGEAVMRTYSEGDGAVKGIHLITISKMEGSGAAAVADMDSTDYNPNVTAAPAAKSLIPMKYSTPASGLTLQVGDSKITELIELVD